MNKLNRILVGLLVVQLLVAAVVLWPRSAASGESASLLPGIEADKITGLTILGADERVITLAYEEGSWVLPEADSYPADKEKVTAFLAKIAGLEADRLVTQTSASHKRLKVTEDDFERRIDVQMADGGRHRLYVGNSPSWGAAHVRADGQDEVYLTRELTSQDAGVDATAWVNTTYVSIPREQIVGITIENQQGSLVLQKEGETWQLEGLPAGETLDESKVTTLLTRVSSVTLVEPLGKDDPVAYGLDDPLAVVTVTTDEGESHVLRVGAQDPEDKSYALASSSSEYYVRVREFVAQDLVEYGLEDLLVPPPTPTPAPEQGPEAAPESTPEGL